jgi:hypothetical protein
MLASEVQPVLKAFARMASTWSRSTTI